jgi:hypothetical protein
VSRAREAGEAPLQTFKMLNDAWVPSLLMMGGMGVYQSYGFFSNWQTSIALAPNKRLSGRSAGCSVRHGHGLSGQASVRGGSLAALSGHDARRVRTSR